MLEIITIGGGEYIVNVMNAVAAWTGDGGFASLIQAVMVMSLAYGLLMMAFTFDWKAFINWFLTATLIYMCLMVPRVTVLVTDRINPGLPGAAVANVPLGLGVIAAFTSQIGDYFVRGSELVFGLPTDLNYSRNGMIYGSRLFEATMAVRINDAEFASNLDEHFKQCVFYDVLLGRKSIDNLARSDDLLVTFGPGAISRAQRWLTRNGDGTVSSEIITCRDAYSRFVASWDTMQTPLERQLGVQLYPRLLPDAARSKLVADLPGAYDYLTGVSRSASQILRQNLMINAMTQAMHTMQSGGSPSAVDVYAQTRAEIQTRNTYSAISSTAMKWVPLLNIVLTVVFYALFPITFPLFLFPRTGAAVLKGYTIGFFYLAAWGPLYVILNMILSLKARSDVLAAGAPGAGGVTVSSFVGIQGVNDDVGLLAGYLIASIPFLAAGIARGALAISTQATSYLAPSQNASEEAAREASTGNISFGNTSMETSAFNQKQGNLWSTLPSYNYGVPSYTQTNADGSRAATYPTGTVIDGMAATSKLPFTPQLTSDYQASFTKSATELFGRAETLANSASSSFSAANTQAADFRRTLSAGTASDTSFGSADQQSINQTWSQIDSAAKLLQERLGFDRQTAETAATQYMFSGSLNTGIGWPGGPAAGGSAGGPAANGSPVTGRAGVGVNTSASKSAGTSMSVGASSAISQAQDLLASVSRSQSWSNTREGFFRATANSSSSDIRARSESLSASYTEADSTAREARSTYETARRYEEAATLRDSEGASISDNLSQRFVNFVLSEQARTPWLQHDWNPTRGMPTTRDELMERDMYLDKFMEAEKARIANSIDENFVPPTPVGLVWPAPKSAGDVAVAGSTARARVVSTPVPTPDNLRTTGDVYRGRGDIQGNVAETGEARLGGYIDERKEEFKGVDKNLSDVPQDTMDNVVGKDERGLWDTTLDGAKSIFTPKKDEK